jgi:hypothetical protein
MGFQQKQIEAAKAAIEKKTLEIMREQLGPYIKEKVREVLKEEGILK